MVDRTLNYGRDIVARFVADVDVRVALDLGPGSGKTSPRFERRIQTRG